MPQLTINGQHIEAAENATVLEAAQAAGVSIPTLCHCPGIEPQTSCMVCVVKDAATGGTLLSCATKAADGMDIITDDEEVRALRRDTLALLLAEHAGDCEGPCERACPAALRVPQMLRCLQEGDVRGALAIAREDLLFPALLGRICAAPCERVCRRGQYDNAIAIRSVHGSLAEAFIEEPLPLPQAATGKAVAIIGAGLAGLAATRALAQLGYGCRLYEKEDILCPGLRGEVSDTLLDAEFAFLQAWDMEVSLSTKVAINPEDSFFGVLPLTTCLEENDMVILACEGASAPDGAKIVTAREEKMPARAVASGKRAAQQVHALLSNSPFHGKRLFNSHLGRLADDELDAYRKNRDCPKRAQRDGTVPVFSDERTQRDGTVPVFSDERTQRDGTVPVFSDERAQRDGTVPVFSDERAQRDGTVPVFSENTLKREQHTEEALRCLHCDCLKPDTCKLRQYAEEYDVTLGARYGAHRPKVKPIERSGSLLYEPGKCIKCGVCVAIARKHEVHPGMAMTGRGLASQVRPALGATPAEGLGAVAAECVRACPTAALAWERETKDDDGAN